MMPTNISETKKCLFDKAMNNGIAYYSFDTNYYVNKYHCLNVKILVFLLYCLQETQVINNDVKEILSQH